MVKQTVRMVVALAVGGLLGLALPAAAQTTYSITDLGALPGTVSCSATAINDAGEVVGSCFPGGSFSEVAFAWSDGTMTNLGKLPKGSYSEAHAVNNHGVVVGEGDVGDFRPDPVLYRNGAVIDIDSSSANARAIYVSDTGVIVGDYAKGFDGVSAWSAVIWTERPTQPGRFDRVSLQPFPGGDAKVRYGYATGANQGVQVVGFVQNSLFGQRGAFWNNDVNHTLALLQPLADGWTSYAWGVNDLGQAVGESDGPNGTRAVLWNNDGTHSAVDLGALPGDTYSTATAINNVGVVLGVSSPAAGSGRPVVWHGGQIADLGSLLDPTVPAEWVVQSAAGINNLGQIVGVGLHNGQPAAFVMTPVQP